MPFLKVLPRFIRDLLGLLFLKLPPSALGCVNACIPVRLGSQLQLRSDNAVTLPGFQILSGLFLRLIELFLLLQLCGVTVLFLIAWEIVAFAAYFAVSCF